MFSLVYPVIMLEKTSIMGSLSISQALVKDRWSKTFGLLLLIGIIFAVVSGIGVLIASPFGVATGVFTPLIAGILTAIVAPIFPIAITIYYYSMKARTLPPPPPPPPPQTL
jgi:hypothetical protein